MDWFRRLLVAEKGSILMMSAFALTAIMGMTGLAVEIGNGYTTKVRNQRVADMAALGAALAYQSTASTAMATQVAKDIVTSSGLAATAATVTMPVTVGSVSGVQVQITTAVPVRLAAMLGGGPSYSVSTSAIASLGGNTTLGCVMALDKSATNGIFVDGASGIDTSGCAVLSNSAITLNGSGSLKASTIVSGSTISKPQYSGTIVGDQRPNTANAASDPLTDNAALTAAFALLGTNSATPTPPTQPSAANFSGSGTDWTFPGSASAYTSLAASDPVKTNCTLSGSQFSCAAGAYNINNLTIPGSMKVAFAGPSTIVIYGTVNDGGAGLSFGGGAGASIRFKNGYTSNSTGVTFGNMDVYFGGNVMFNGISSVGAGNLMVAGGIKTNGASTTTVGAGSFVVGKDSNGYSIDHGGSATITFGNGNFSGTGGLHLGGSSTMTFGTGNMTLGTSNNNGAIYDESGNLTMGAGDLNTNGGITTTGGSNIVFGAGNHFINGTVTIASGGTLGAGRYTINGNFLKSSYAAGIANGVTIIASGSFSTDGSASLTLTAPGADSTINGAIGGIAFASKTTLASTIAGSSANTLGGAFYIPNSALTISGAGSAAAATCFAMIVKTLTVTGSGSTTDTNCKAPTITSANSVALIQ